MQLSISFLDDTIRDIVYAVRGFRRARLVTFTIVATIALGLGLVTVAFSLLNMLLFRADRVPDVDQLFAVERPRTSDDERQQFTRAQFDALRRETDVFSDAFAQVSDVDTRVEGRTVPATYVTGNFFEVLRVTAAMGRVFTSADDEAFAGRAVMVLSDRGWDRLFARDPSVVGRSVLVNGLRFEIVGVMPDGFRGLATGPPDDFWAPLAMLGAVRPIHRGRDTAVPVEIIGRLKPGLSRQTALAGLATWATHQSDGGPIERGAWRLTLVPRRGTVQQPLEALMVTAPLFFAFGLILLIGCANVANLLLARAVVRQREIGIRLSLGATRRRLVRQLLIESLLLAFAAAAAGFAISRVVLEIIINAMTATMPPDLGDVRLLVPGADWRVLLFLIAGACLSTIAFALAPALQATRIEPLRTIRGEVVRDTRPGPARDLLIGVQVGVSALLLISAAVFLKSAFAGASFDPGMRIADVVIVPIANESTRNAIVQAVKAEPAVNATAASWPEGLDAPRVVFTAISGARTAVACKFVSPEYFDVLDIAVIRGRLFTPAERTSTLAVAVVSDSTARALWPNADPVGQVVRLEPDQQSRTPAADEPRLESRTCTVVGVVRDVAGFRIAPFPKAVVYVPASDAMPKTALVARVRGDLERARQTLLNRLIAIDPMSQVGSMVWVTRMESFFVRLAFWFTVILGGLALALTVSGLFSVLSYLVEQRAREIGVRMALGATVRDVIRLVLWQSIRPVGLGLVLGGGSAAGFATVLLATPGAAPVGEIVHVLDPSAYAASLMIITAACLVAASIPATRAARLDPMVTLRQD